MFLYTNFTKRNLFVFLFIAVIVLAPVSVSAEISLSSLMEQIKALQQKVLLLQSQIKKTEEAPTQDISVSVAPKASFYFDSSLFVGSLGDEVTKLQEALTEDGVYDGPVTGYFGPLTKAGVKAFQEKYADDVLAPLGLSYGTGYFGLSTRKKLNSLFATAPSNTVVQTDTPVVQVPKIKQYPSVTTSTTPSSTTVLSFNGVDDYVDVGNSASLALSDNFEISLFVKTTDARNATLVGRVDEGGDYNQYWYVGISGDSPGRIETSLGDGTNFSQIFSTISIADGKWHKIVWKRDGDNQTIFIDDVDKTNINYIDPSIGDVNPPTSIIIGGDIESDDYYFNGTLDDVTISVDGAVVGEWNF